MNTPDEQLKEQIELLCDEILKKWKDKRNFKELFCAEVFQFIKNLSLQRDKK